MEASPASRPAPAGSAGAGQRRRRWRYRRLVWLGVGFLLGWWLGTAPAMPQMEGNDQHARAAAPGVLSASGAQLPAWAQAVGKRTLAAGARGEDVRALQRLLVGLGYDLTPDGAYGPATREAVRRFQESAGLPISGKADSRTIQALVRYSWWYPVRRGDTLSGVAVLYETTTATLKRLNGLATTRIQVGQRLLVPRAGFGGTIAEWGQYVVQPGDTLWAVAKRFKMAPEHLQRANALVDPSGLRPGQRLWLPARPARPQPSDAGQSLRLIWPVRGPVTSDYGWRVSPIDGVNREFHEGIDIAVPSGTPVRAAARGTVVQAGWMGAFGYGVVLDHGNGMQTLYGHNRRVAVRPGQQVAQGQVIAWSGSTGRSTGPHVDFRIRQNGRTVDPTTLLTR